MIQSARQIAPRAFVLDVTRCRSSITTASNGMVECLAYDHPSWRDGRPHYEGDFASIEPGDLLILVSSHRSTPVLATVTAVLFDADDDCEPICMLLGGRWTDDARQWY